MNSFHRTLIAAALCGAVFLPTTGNALTFRAETPTTNGLLVLRLDGKIEHGDEFKIVEFYQRAVKQYPNKEPIVFLNSRGGYVSPGIELAKFIHEKKLPVLVEARAECVSSCFMLFSAGTKRFVGKGATIGVHSVFDVVKKAEDEEAQAVTLRMSRILMQYGTPPHIIGKLIATDFQQMYKLTEADLQSMQVANLDGNPPVRIAAVPAVPAKSVAAPAAPTKAVVPPATKPMATTKPMAPVSTKVTSTPAPATTAAAPHSLLGKLYYIVSGK